MGVTAKVEQLCNDTPLDFGMSIPEHDLQLTDSAIIGPTYDVRTTLLVGNIRKYYSLKEIVAELHDGGLDGTFDYVYLQTGRKRTQNRGHCFINFTSHLLALEAWTWLQSHVWKLHQQHHQQQQQQQQLPAAMPHVSWAVIQGLEENVRSRNLAKRSKPGIERNVWTLHHVTAQTQCSGQMCLP